MRYSLNVHWVDVFIRYFNRRFFIKSVFVHNTPYFFIENLKFITFLLAPPLFLTYFCQKIDYFHSSPYKNTQKL